MSALLPEPLLRGTTRAYDIEHLTCGTPNDPTLPEERRLLNLVLPVWQRDFVWTPEQQSAYIEGIFLGLGTGYYVVNGSDWYRDGEQKPMSGWLIDGQQRITSIKHFIEDKIAIFDGIRYSDLSRVQKLKRFLRVGFHCLELEYQEDETVLKTLYNRLNYSGTAHTQADLERLN